jgi:hypothetical protein
MRIPSHLVGIASHSVGIRVPAANNRKRPRAEEQRSESPSSSIDTSSFVAPASSDADVVGDFLHDLRAGITSASTTAMTTCWLLDLRKLALPSRSEWKQLWDGVHTVFSTLSTSAKQQLPGASNRAHRLVALELEGSQLGGEGVATLAEAFADHRTTFSSVTCWFLASTRLSHGDLELLLNAWQAADNYGKTVKIIGLTNNPLIGSEDQSIFAVLSSVLPCVQRLHANHVGLTTAGWKLWLPKLVVSLPFLKNLWLKQNPKLEGAVVLSDVAPHGALAKGLVL